VVAEFSSGQDHGKLAVGKNGDDALFCIGDLNRVESQMRRGGGVLCFRDNIGLASAMRNLVNQTECTIIKQNNNTVLPPGG